METSVTGNQHKDLLFFRGSRQERKFKDRKETFGKTRVSNEHSQKATNLFGTGGKREKRGGGWSKISRGETEMFLLFPAVNLGQLSSRECL